MKRVIILAAMSLSVASSFLLAAGSQGTPVDARTLARMRGGDPKKARCDSFCDVEVGLGPACPAKAKSGECKVCMVQSPDGSWSRSAADGLGSPGTSGCDNTGNKKRGTSTSSCGHHWYGYCYMGYCYGGPQGKSCDVGPVENQ